MPRCGICAAVQVNGDNDLGAEHGQTHHYVGDDNASYRLAGRVRSPLRLRVSTYRDPSTGKCCSKVEDSFLHVRNLAGEHSGAFTQRHANPLLSFGERSRKHKSINCRSYDLGSIISKVSSPSVKII